MHQIAVVVFPDFQVLDLAAMAAFELANKETGTSHYDVSVVSERGGTISSSFGISVDSLPFGSASTDTVLVAGSLRTAASTPALLSYLRQLFDSARRVASIGTGAFILAEAGLLDGRCATTHWNHARALQARFPRVKVQEDRIFTRDGKVWTSAGMTACLDMTLAFVEDDLGPETARAVARKMVVYHRRVGGQSQFSALLELQPRTDRMHKTLTYAKANLHLPLSVEDLANVAHLSPRQFSRAFKLETGQSPARAIEQMRLEAARNMINVADHPLSVVASKTGFGDMERMRRAFLRAFGQPPRAVRRTALTDAFAGLSVAPEIRQLAARGQTYGGIELTSAPQTTVTRAEVKQEPVRARAAGELPFAGEAYRSFEAFQTHARAHASAGLALQEATKALAARISAI